MGLVGVLGDVGGRLRVVSVQVEGDGLFPFFLGQLNLIQLVLVLLWVQIVFSTAGSITLIFRLLLDNLSNFLLSS